MSTPALGHEPDGSNPRTSPPASTAGQQSGVVGRRPLDLRSLRRARQQPRRPSRPRRLGPDVATGLTGEQLDRPYSGGDSVSRATAWSRSPPAIICILPTSGSPPAAASAGSPISTASYRPRSGPAAKLAGHLELRPAADRRLDDHPARLRPGEEISADPRDPRRSVGGLRPDLLDGRPALCRRRLRRALCQPARLDLVRPGVRGRDRQELSRATTMTT